MIFIEYALIYLMVGFVIASVFAKFSNWLEQDGSTNFMNIMVSWGFLLLIIPILYILDRFGLSMKNWVDYLQKRN
jgi:choline-glycine betaine transporter